MLGDPGVIVPPSAVSAARHRRLRKQPTMRKVYVAADSRDRDKISGAGDAAPSPHLLPAARGSAILLI